jgi:hypothetical protein
MLGLSIFPLFMGGVFVVVGSISFRALICGPRMSPKTNARFTTGSDGFTKDEYPAA